MKKLLFGLAAGLGLTLLAPTLPTASACPCSGAKAAENQCGGDKKEAKKKTERKKKSKS